MRTLSKVLLGLGALFPGIHSAADPSWRVLVLPVDSPERGPSGESSFLTGELAGAISRLGRFEVISKNPSELPKIFEQHGKRQPRDRDEATLLDLGAWMNVDYVAVGKVRNMAVTRQAIELTLVGLKEHRTLSRIQLMESDVRDRLLWSRLARLLLWGKLRVACNRSPFDATLDGKVLDEETLDPDYDVWLVEPGMPHALEVKARGEFSVFKTTIALGVGEARIEQVKLRSRMGVLAVQSRPETNVYLDDRLVGSSPLQREVPAGEYTLALSAGRHDDVVRRVAIQPDETTYVRASLPVNAASYRRNGLISAACAILSAGGALFASSEAEKAYSRYLETMDRNRMSRDREKAKTLDLLTYAGYGLAGGFAVWSLLEWLGLISAQEEPFMTNTPAVGDHPIMVSPSPRGFTLTIGL